MIHLLLSCGRDVKIDSDKSLDEMCADLDEFNGANFVVVAVGVAVKPNEVIAVIKVNE